MIKKFDIKNLINNDKITRVAIIVLVVALVLIFLSSFIDTSSILSNKVSIDDYTVELESRLLTIVTQIQGVGQAQIFLTMDNEGENIFLNNTNTKVQSITPVVRGVVVVCEGGDDPVVVSRVMSAITSSLDISSDKVCITKLTDQGGNNEI